MTPTAWYDPSNGHVSTDRDSPLFTPLGQVWPLYPKGEWVGLTDEEYIHITDSVYHKGHGLVAYYKAIEQALKEQNA